MGLLPKAKRFLCFGRARIVGDIARNARPRRIDGDVLYVGHLICMGPGTHPYAEEHYLADKRALGRELH